MAVIDKIKEIITTTETKEISQSVLDTFFMEEDSSKEEKKSVYRYLRGEKVKVINDIDNDLDDEGKEKLAVVINANSPLRQYYQEIGKIDILTPSQEYVLGKMKDGEKLSLFDKYVYFDKEGKSLSEEDKMAILKGKKPVSLAKLLKVYKAEKNKEFRVLTPKEASDFFIVSNLRLAARVAGKFHSKLIGKEDLIQQANLGIITAVEKFNYRYGFKFSTYATNWICQSVGRAIADQDDTFRLPVDVVFARNAYHRHVSELVKKIGREPTEAEVLESYDDDIIEECLNRYGHLPDDEEYERVKKVFARRLDVIRNEPNVQAFSLNEPARAEEPNETEMGDLLSDNFNPVEEEVFNMLIKEDVKFLLNYIKSPKNRAFLIMRTGLFNYLSDSELEALKLRYTIRKLSKVDPQFRKEINRRITAKEKENEFKRNIGQDTNVEKRKEELLKEIHNNDFFQGTHQNRSSYKKDCDILVDYNIIGYEKLFYDDLEYIRSHPRYEKCMREAADLYTYDTTYRLEEVGYVFGVTRERVRQVESKCLRQLCHLLDKSEQRGRRDSLLAHVGISNSAYEKSKVNRTVYSLDKYK